MRIRFLGSAKPAAQRAVQLLIARYGQSEIEEATHIVAIGGDGTALNALHAVLPTRQPVFAMRLPESVGALGNPFDPLGLPERLTGARKISVRPLKAEATRVAGGTATIFGINEIVVSRQRLQAAKLHVRMGEGSDVESSSVTACWSAHQLEVLATIGRPEDRYFRRA